MLAINGNYEASIFELQLCLSLNSQNKDLCNEISQELDRLEGLIRNNAAEDNDYDNPGNPEVYDGSLRNMSFAASGDDELIDNSYN